MRLPHWLIALLNPIGDWLGRQGIRGDNNDPPTPKDAP